MAIFSYLYYVVEFPDEAVDGNIPMSVISHSWLSRNEKGDLTCLWPKRGTNSQRIQLIRNHEFPSSFTSGNNVNIKYRSFTYEKALSKMNALQNMQSVDQSEVSEVETRKRGTHKPKHFEYFISSSGSEEDLPRVNLKSKRMKRSTTDVDIFDANNNEAKQKAWEAIGREFNSTCSEGRHRTVESLKKLYSNNKKDVGKIVAEERRGTGKVVDSNSNTDLILSTVNNATMAGVVNENDCDGDIENSSGKRINVNQSEDLVDNGLSIIDVNETLADFKSKTKQKAAKINQSQNKTGGGPVLEITLTVREERLLSIMGTKSIKGDPSLEFGVNLQQHQLNTSTTLREMPSTSTNEEVLVQLRSQLGEVIEEILNMQSIINENEFNEHDYTTNVYGTIKDNNKRSGQGRVNWEYFETFERIFRDDKTINFGPTIDLMTVRVLKLPRTTPSEPATSIDERKNFTDITNIPSTSQQDKPLTLDPLIDENRPPIRQTPKRKRGGGSSSIQEQLVEIERKRS
ncbi:hypothetical protein RN001_003737 [Aquatica leii]|uniref:Regulatory protein zeste n=1 Tax=Aquatica leii TaxID=1421715 RepID=A0AAN7PRH0_9COLE|nr:hypothetical protein RN001_003737 [Aquatica leii]